MNMKSDPLYAIGFEHGLDGLINEDVDSEAYTSGQKAGSEARAIFSAAGFKPVDKGTFSVSMTISPTNEEDK